jgi:hypothetical protein
MSFVGYASLVLRNWLHEKLIEVVRVGKEEFLYALPFETLDF